MTKGQLVEQVYLMLSGGVLSTDNEVWKQDIESLLPSVIDTVNLTAIREAKALALQERRETSINISVADIMQGLATPIKGTATYSETEKLHKLDIGVSLLAGTGYSVLSVILTNAPDKVLIRLNSIGQARFLAFPCFWFEGSTMYLKNLPSISDPELSLSVMAKYVDSGNEDEELNIVAGHEKHVIDMLYNTLLPQKNQRVLNNKNGVQDDSDNNRQVNQ